MVGLVMCIIRVIIEFFPQGIALGFSIWLLQGGRRYCWAMLKVNRFLRFARNDMQGFVRVPKYWLRLLQKSNLTTIQVDGYINDIESIINILTKIVKTTSERINNG